MGAFPQSQDGQYLKECGSQFYGHDLPGYQISYCFIFQFYGHDFPGYQISFFSSTDTTSLGTRRK
jgi:hypothetical protein